MLCLLSVSGTQMDGVLPLEAAIISTEPAATAGMATHSSGIEDLDDLCKYLYYCTYIYLFETGDVNTVSEQFPKPSLVFHICF